MITKTDFMLFLEAPLHVWAKKHGQFAMVLSAFDQHLLEQGKQIEKLSRVFLEEYLNSKGLSQQFQWEQTFKDSNFQARVDGLVFDPEENVYDLYEIKSSTSVKREHRYDVTFQQLVCEASISIRDFYLIYVNKDYIKSGEIDLSKLFLLSRMNEDIGKLRDEVALLREQAWQVSISATPDGIQDCLKPKLCPCPHLCHPELPEHSIFDLPRLHKNKARGLKESGILAINQIPKDYPLSDRQRLHAETVRKNTAEIERSAIKRELAKLEFPLYFLDYETFNPGVPRFEGYKPYQHMVFQYSLHVVDAPDATPEHFECLITDEDDPAIKILEHLLRHIGKVGSVIVWNKAFEVGKNREMADRYPAYENNLKDINNRIFDLMEIFSKGYYVHPDFRGSASIKKVLPVLVTDPELSYEELPISKGDDAMLTWYAIISGEIPREEVPQKRHELLRYCELDTLAMVKCWEVLKELLSSPST